MKFVIASLLALVLVAGHSKSSKSLTDTVKGRNPSSVTPSALVIGYQVPTRIEPGIPKQEREKNLCRFHGRGKR